METRMTTITPIRQVLEYGRPVSDEPISRGYRPEWFKECCEFVCPSFKVDESNKSLINEVYRYVEGVSLTLKPHKGLLLTGPIGTGKSTIMQIINRYSYFTMGKDQGDYPIGGFRIESASSVTNSYTKSGQLAVEPYTYNNAKPKTICFDELGREPMPAKYFGTELNVMQYILQCRYELRMECITHITTNLTLPEIEAQYGSYIADRINEMFNVITVRGDSRR